MFKTEIWPRIQAARENFHEVMPVLVGVGTMLGGVALEFVGVPHAAVAGEVAAVPSGAAFVKPLEEPLTSVASELITIGSENIRTVDRTAEWVAQHLKPVDWTMNQ